jgi:hypothetical protein
MAEKGPNLWKDCFPTLLLSNYRQVQELLYFPADIDIVSIGKMTSKRRNYYGPNFLLSDRIFRRSGRKSLPRVGSTVCCVSQSLSWAEPVSRNYLLLSIGTSVNMGPNRPVNSTGGGGGMDQITIKTPNPKCRLYRCLLEFIY